MALSGFGVADKHTASEDQELGQVEPVLPKCCLVHLCFGSMDLRSSEQCPVPKLPHLAPHTHTTAVRSVSKRHHGSLGVRLNCSMATSDGNVSCEYYHQGGSTPAFLYYHLEPNGSRTEVQPMTAPNGLCYFPEASCGNEDFWCCAVSEPVAHAADRGMQLNTLYCIIAIILTWYLPRLCRSLYHRLRQLIFGKAPRRIESSIASFMGG